VENQLRRKKSRKKKKKSENDQDVPLILQDILPPCGSSKGGSRVAILGSGFENCSNLKVKFGKVVVPATFHEDVTLICITPSLVLAQEEIGQSEVSVSVANDGENFCVSNIRFRFL